MATSRPPPPSKPLDLDITIVSAKHLKNVNWRSDGGELKPYAIFWVDPDRRLATKSDDSGSTKPVWNERFVVPVPFSLHDSLLTLEIFHSKPSETPKPLIGTLRFPLSELVDPSDSTRLRTFELFRPSGRPQGKIRLKLAVRERPSPPPPPQPDYHIAPQQSYYYSAAPSPARDYRGYNPPSPYTSSLPPPPPPSPSPAVAPTPSQPYTYGGYSDPYPGYYSGYYSQPPPPPRPFYDRPAGYGGGPSAPVDYTPYDQKPKGGKMGLGAGLAAGAVAGALGGLALEEGLKYEEDQISERVESDMAARDDYRDLRNDY